MWGTGLIVAGLLAAAGTGAERGEVTGTAAEKVEVLPSAMRTTLAIRVAADTLEKAMADIQAQLNAVRGKLEALMPLAGTLTVQGPRRETGLSREERMRMAASRRFGPTTRPAKENVVLTAEVSAEWRLVAPEPFALLREVEKLQNDVRKALPPPAVETKGPTTEEEEERALREMAEMETGGGPPPGAPVFGFVGRLSQEQLDKARREAFLKARHEAHSIARAAGGRLGRLASVLSNVLGSSSQEDYEDYSYMRAFMRTMGGALPSGAVQTEAITPSLRQIVFTVSVSATFHLEAAE